MPEETLNDLAAVVACAGRKVRASIARRGEEAPLGGRPRASGVSRRLLTDARADRHLTPVQRWARDVTLARSSNCRTARSACATRERSHAVRRAQVTLGRALWPMAYAFAVNV